MARCCTICAHLHREDIDGELLAGASFRDIAGRYRVGRSALHRHRENGHIAEPMVLAAQADQETRAVVLGGNLLNDVQSLRDRALAVLDGAEGEADRRLSLHAIREVRECIKLLGVVRGELQEGTTINILASPDWDTWLFCAQFKFLDSGGLTDP